MKGDCVVCYEPTNDHTDCQHFLCRNCATNLWKRQCPYCRKNFTTTIKMAWQHFLYLFDAYYRRNAVYQRVKAGEDIILQEDVLHYVEHLDDFDPKSIPIKIVSYQVYLDRWKRYEIVFYVDRLEQEEDQHTFLFLIESEQGRILDQYLSSENVELCIA